MSKQTAAMLTSDRPPPKDYYQNNCRVLLEFVLERDAALLDDASRAQLQTFFALSDDAQRLLARLLTRKRPLIRVDSLNYREIFDCRAALQELEAYGFIHLCSAAPADQLLHLLNKSELQQFAADIGHVHLTSQQKKADMVLKLLSCATDRQLQLQLTDFFEWLRLRHAALWWLVRLFYFGDNVQDWSAFVVRDLGMIRYESVPLEGTRFRSREDLDRYLYFRRLSHLAHRLTELPELADDLVQAMADSGAAPVMHEDRFLRRRCSRTLVRLGRWYERQERLQAARNAYEMVDMHPARERLVRVLTRQGETELAAHLLASIRELPRSDEEAQFAERFGVRGGGFQPPTMVFEVAAARADIEQQALELYLQHLAQAGADPAGLWGAHVENSLFRTLTGLIYWEVIFATVPGAFTNPFQTAPHDLYEDDFAAVRQAELQQLEDRLQSDTALAAHLHRISQQKQGVANRLVNWRLLEQVPLTDFLEAMPLSDVRRLCHFMVRHLGERRAGLPDLFIGLGRGRYELIEVKGPGDQLQPGQRVWLQHLARMQMPAQVLRLKVTG